jgi:hypothetical protein
MDSDNATSVQPQTQAMGAARRDPGRGEIPMVFAYRQTVYAAALKELLVLFTPWDVVSNKGAEMKNKQIV